MAINPSPQLNRGLIVISLVTTAKYGHARKGLISTKYGKKEILENSKFNEQKIDRYSFKYQLLMHNLNDKLIPNKTFPTNKLI
ncbi:hypothetical protein BTJ40_19830 [Microbulbifer sp. A4B17]|nr:hypothetical protein BTJ40_19830 [Microbulbifer sp. A4B17]